MKNYRVLFPEIKMKYNEKETVVTVVKESNLDKLINLAKLEAVIFNKRYIKKCNNIFTWRFRWNYSFDFTGGINEESIFRRF